MADLVWSLTRRFPEIYQEFRERIALQEGDVDRLLEETREQIRQVTSEQAWRNHWNDEGHIPTTAASGIASSGCWNSATPMRSSPARWPTTSWPAATSTPTTAPVEALVARHLKKHGGSAERSLAAIPTAPSTRASLAEIGDPDVEATLSRIGSGSRSSHDDDADSDRTASYAVGSATSDGQRFRVLRPHAKGGLGAVFVALDAELNREVALKQILDRHADDPTSRARFLLEAEVTGGLEHPGIVPVYGLGTYPDGRPYYDMRFVKGDSLKEAIDRFHADAALRKDPGRRGAAARAGTGPEDPGDRPDERRSGRGGPHDVRTIEGPLPGADRGRTVRPPAPGRMGPG